MILSSLIPWRNKFRNEEDVPVTALSRFHSEVDRLFDRFFAPFWSESDVTHELGSWSPMLDMSENDKEFTVQVEVPGVDAEDFDIAVSGNVLTISGEKKEEREEREGNVYRAERRFGSFRRGVPLPESVDAEKVSADYDKGVLTVHLPKTEKAKAKRIPVSASKK